MVRTTRWYSSLASRHARGPPVRPCTRAPFPSPLLARRSCKLQHACPNPAPRAWATCARACGPRHTGRRRESAGVPRAAADPVRSEDPSQASARRARHGRALPAACARVALRGAEGSFQKKPRSQAAAVGSDLLGSGGDRPVGSVARRGVGPTYQAVRRRDFIHAAWRAGLPSGTARRAPPPPHTCRSWNLVACS